MALRAERVACSLCGMACYVSEDSGRSTCCDGSTFPIERATPPPSDIDQFRSCPCGQGHPERCDDAPHEQPGAATTERGLRIGHSSNCWHAYGVVRNRSCTCDHDAVKRIIGKLRALSAEYDQRLAAYKAKSGEERLCYPMAVFAIGDLLHEVDTLAALDRGSDD
jgi:hypothetical protein